jgi:hypothetical protein
MAFLDNSGDIILDAVLTDTGRMRLAKGDGSFKITKFALGDDEINYRLYRNINNPEGRDPSGSAFYDLAILQTPVLEAFTNNTSLLKHRLTSYVRNDLLYLPVVMSNTLDNGALAADTTYGNIHFVAVDDSSATAAKNNLAASSRYMDGFAPQNSNGLIRLDFGLDTPLIPKENKINMDLEETQIIVELDNRLAELVDPKQANQSIPYDYLDDDQVASYILTGYIQPNTQANSNNKGTFVLRGPAQGFAEFKFRVKSGLQYSDTLFNQFGTTVSGPGLVGDVNGTWKYIDSVVKFTGGNTGYSVEIPVRFAKQTATG